MLLSCSQRTGFELHCGSYFRGSKRSYREGDFDAFGGFLSGPLGQNMASILAVGLVLGTFPIFGCPMVLCALASLVLGLNFPALQLINQLSWPLQIAMLIPCMRLGARIVDFPHDWPV